MPDLTLTCRDCGQPFQFTQGEQDFYNSKGYTQPSRCASCRATKKAQRNDGYGDSDYGNSNSSYGNSSYSSGGYSSGGVRGERQMTSVTCSNCGKPAQVPFVPSGDRPVYCSDCFTQFGGGARSGGRSRY